ncbi:MAG: hypothetical protein ACPGOV_14250 [Magnetovibrionaceae bacterium]
MSLDDLKKEYDDLLAIKPVKDVCLWRLPNTETKIDNEAQAKSFEKLAPAYVNLVTEAAEGIAPLGTVPSTSSKKDE